MYREIYFIQVQRCQAYMDSLSTEGGCCKLHVLCTLVHTCCCPDDELFDAYCCECQYRRMEQVQLMQHAKSCRARTKGLLVEIRMSRRSSCVSGTSCSSTMLWVWFHTSSCSSSWAHPRTSWVNLRQNVKVCTGSDSVYTGTYILYKYVQIPTANGSHGWNTHYFRVESAG